MIKSSRPEIFSQGNPSTIFPADAKRERRLVSIFISVLTKVEPLAHFMFKECGLKTWKPAKWEGFTEVVSPSDPSQRIDGYVSATYGKNKSSALIEAKVNKATLEKEKVLRYAKVAKENNIDAMITISNQRVSRPSQSLVKPNKVLKRSVTILHWSWAYIETQCRLFRDQCNNLTSEQKFILEEFINMISNPKSGSSRHEKMPNGWESVVDSLFLNNKPGNVSCFAEGWIQEQQDIALELSKKSDTYVKVSIEKEHKENYECYKKYISNNMKKNRRLEASFIIPNAADNLYLIADIANKTVSASMTLEVPPEFKNRTPRGHVSWISKMIETRDKRVHIEPIFGKKPSNMVPLAEFIDNRKHIMNEAMDKRTKLKSFKFIIFKDIGKDFSSSKNFIKCVDEIVIDFYDIVGRNLKRH